MNREAFLRRRRNAYLLRVYGITATQEDTLRSWQGGGCAVCGATENLVVDHCHTTGRVRGILCAKCNSSAGIVADDAERLRRLADYLDEPPAHRLLLFGYSERMATDRGLVSDSFTVEMMMGRGMESKERVLGHGVVEVFAPDGTLKQSVPFTNRVTDYGDEYYTRRGAGVTAPTAATGMQLGTGGATAASKNGAGAAIVTLVASSLVAFDGGFPTAATLGAGLGWRAQYKTTWAAGIATATGINEVVITNQATATQTAAPAGATISRAVLGTAVNKAAGDTLAITWNHDLTGA